MCPPSADAATIAPGPEAICRSPVGVTQLEPPLCDSRAVPSPAADGQNVSRADHPTDPARMPRANVRRADQARLSRDRRGVEPLRSLKVAERVPPRPGDPLIGDRDLSGIVGVPGVAVRALDDGRRARHDVPDVDTASARVCDTRPVHRNGPGRARRRLHLVWGLLRRPRLGRSNEQRGQQQGEGQPRGTEPFPLHVPHLHHDARAR